jgi:hypothetical protein
MEDTDDTDQGTGNPINLNRGGSRKEKRMNAITKTTPVAVLVALGLTLTTWAAEPPASTTAAPAVRAGESVAPVSKPATGPALRHVFLAVDESRKQIHYVDQNDPSRDWSVATVHNGKPLCIRDLALAGAQRLVMAARNGEGIFILDLQSRQYWRIGSGGVQEGELMS